MFRIQKGFVLFFLIFLGVLGSAVLAQNSLPVKEWIKKLEDDHDPNSENFRIIIRQLLTADSINGSVAYHELEERQESANLFFKTRFHCIAAIYLSRYDRSRKMAEVKALFELALKEAYSTGNIDLTSYISWLFGSNMYGRREMELAATYCLRAVEMNDRFLPYGNGYVSASVLGEILFHCREYEKSIYYSRWSIAHWPDTSSEKANFVTKLWNTIGQAYQRMGMLDSAMVNYERSMEIATSSNSQVWKAINSGYKGQVFFLKKEFDKAKPLFTYDYGINKNIDLNIAANSIHWMAKINLIQGKKDSALVQAKEALKLLSVSDPIFYQKGNYLQDTYYTIADIYRSLGKTDSFSRYFQLYITLHDSLERVVARSSFDISTLRNDNVKKYYEIQALQREKQLEREHRNLIIAAILFLSAISILLINRQRLKIKYKEQIALHEKLRAEQEIKGAREQLEMFTLNIIEKTSLVEELERKVRDNTASSENQQVLTELSQRTILTEEDWNKFKSLFEKLFPLFFQRLKNKAADITVAEQRMAALTRLQLTGRQMASMLGISVESVSKTRQRLRKRFELANDVNLEEYISSI